MVARTIAFLGMQHAHFRCKFTRLCMANTGSEPKKNARWLQHVEEAADVLYLSGNHTDRHHVKRVESTPPTGSFLCRGEAVGAHALRHLPRSFPEAGLCHDAQCSRQQGVGRDGAWGNHEAEASVHGLHDIVRLVPEHRQADHWDAMVCCLCTKFPHTQISSPCQTKTPFLETRSTVCSSAMPVVHHMHTIDR